MTCRNSIVALLSKPILKFTTFGKNLSWHHMPIYSQRAPNFSTYLLWILRSPWLRRGMIVKFIKPNEFLFYCIQPNPHPLPPGGQATAEAPPPSRLGPPWGGARSHGESQSHPFPGMAQDICCARVAQNCWLAYRQTGRLASGHPGV